MKSFKKVMAGMLMGIMVIGMLTGCGGDPVADDFEKFLNTDMVDVNANYDKIKEETAKWGDLETNEEIKDSINNGIMPNIDDSLDKLSKIKPETDECGSSAWPSWPCLRPRPRSSRRRHWPARQP